LGKELETHVPVVSPFARAACRDSWRHVNDRAGSGHDDVVDEPLPDLIQLFGVKVAAVGDLRALGRSRLSQAEASALPETKYVASSG
jgi:hypothetical protein